MEIYKSKIDNVIIKDSKLLIRHLKELHILKQYFIKLDIEECKTYNSWIKYLLNNKKIYLSLIPSFLIDNPDDVLEKCISLVANIRLFKPWVSAPIVLSNFDFKQSYMLSDNHEIQAWYYVSTKFLENKTLYMKIKKLCK